MFRRSQLAGFLWLTVLLAEQPEAILERLRRAPLSPDQISQVEASLASKDYSRIDALVRTAAHGDAAHAGELYAMLGAVEFVGGRMAAAARAFRDSDSLAPLNERDRFTLAMSLVNVGDTEGARTELALLNHKKPEQPLYLYWLARLDYYQRRYEDSISKLRRVLELDPQSARAEDNLGLSLDMFGRPEEARIEFEKAVALNRNLPQPSPWPPHNLGYLLLRLEKLEDAEKALRESLRYDSGLAQSHYYLGRVLEKQARDAEAIDELRAAISLDASAPEACYSLGQLYRRLNRKKESDAAFAEYRRRKAAPGNP
ncbi:MAG: tetratricopeptide repeat protein [Acidobacteriia bacterium]|nr:tetratricopeptide repeat protein [Terriglobia bacterium]